MKAGWETKTLGDVCHVYQPETISQKQMIEGVFPVYGANGQIGLHNQFNHEEKQLILGCRGSCGSVHFTAERSWINGNAMVVQPKSKVIDVSFLAYALRGGIDISSAITGAAQPQITRTSLMPIMIMFPSAISEQARLVGILDEAFDSIVTAKANAEKNLRNSKQIYASVLENLYADIGESHSGKELGDFIETLTDYHANGSYEILKQHVDLKDTEDYAWMVRSTDFENNFLNNKRYITKHAYEFLTKSRILGGEIIMSKIGNAGKVYLMPEIARPCSLAMNLFLIRLDERKVTNKYVYHYLKTCSGGTQIQSRLNGVATQTITKESVRSLQIPICSHEKQLHIVSMLEELSEETQHLESIYQQKLSALDALKKSLLDQAFTGQL